MPKAAAIVSTKKDPLERYYTPIANVTHHIRTIAPYIVNRGTSRVFFDPFCGDNRYAMEVHRMLPAGYVSAYYTSDLANTGVHWEAALNALPPDAKVLCVTNPPFSHAAGFINALLAKYPDALLSLLLPTSFLEATKERGVVFENTPPSQLTFIGRISFEGPGRETFVTSEKSFGKAAMPYVLMAWNTKGPVLSWAKP
jgi:hypothetical protein